MTSTETRTLTRVLIWYRAPEDDPGAVLRSFHEVSPQLQGTAGLVRSELLRNPLDPASYLVASEWESLDAFRTWESGPDHRGRTSPMRPYQDREPRTAHWAVYTLVAQY